MARSPRQRSRTPAALVVIGVHRDELAFGERVVQGLDTAHFAVLRIPEGLLGQRPRQDQFEQHLRRHHALYSQIHDQFVPGQRLLVDLHSGLDRRGRCADVLCADPRQLGCIATRTAVADPAGGTVRAIQLIADTALPELREAGVRPWPVARPEIPEAVWGAAEPLYVGLEVYLRRPGTGTPGDWAFARCLLATIADCVLRDRAPGDAGRP
ncbi:hypothetical protein [Thiococcus pfennigii]|uniref:hypothetical protein n=1 Tax=Thiococcus pfennigii TaxID=1057 RepID=UPI001906EC69|nr:hypothetical protein [Thiococcus pfennigii]MBK1700309.1 hypothetical protein [Thiococcus pfennigii]MBK1730555.1 hypothetical protein [Thiococcus pfennigii]